jgi:hypothetical protein
LAVHSPKQTVQWQDLKVSRDLDLVLSVAQQNGWKDCEIFGYGDMRAQPLESNGWNLIPADVFQYSIPAEGVNRIVTIMNAGVRIQGVIIADDLRKTEPPPAPKKPLVTLPSAASVLSTISKVLTGLIVFGAVVLFGRILLTVALVLGAIIVLCMAITHDPKLIILVEDGNGNTAWVSVLTWFD